MNNHAANTNHRLPRLAITMGDPAGVGPEIISAAWQSQRLHDACQPVVIGSAATMRKAVALRCPNAVQVVHAGDATSIAELAAESSPDAMPVLAESDAAASSPPDEAAEIQPRVVDPRAGRLAHQAITTAGQLAIAGEVVAIVTAPIHKKSLREAGIDFPGHTELFAQMCGVEEFAMMLYRPNGSSPAADGSAETDHDRVGERSPGLGVAHVTLHTALRDIFPILTTAAIVEKAKLLDEMLSTLHSGVSARPRIGIAALNPHGGEAGLFGQEEIEIIAPAVEAARAAGLSVQGPVPADTLFRQAAAGTYEGVVAMYHDQGHIALKLLGMHDIVNVTLGLPIVRTSVAHGTAFDIAWQGKAAPDSLLQAIDVAAKLAQARLPQQSG